jgi:hypothetical protein
MSNHRLEERYSLAEGMKIFRIASSGLHEKFIFLIKLIKVNGYQA